MDWSASTTWWVIAGALVAAELTSGTFYLLMLALGAAAGAMSAHLGLAPSGQLLAAAVVGGSAVLLCHRRRSRRAQALPAQRNPDVNLDIGQRVQVAQWQEDKTTQVHYRGAAWHARFVGHGEASPGPHVIHAIEGSCLLLTR